MYLFQERSWRWEKQEETPSDGETVLSSTKTRVAQTFTALVRHTQDLDECVNELGVVEFVRGPQDEVAGQPIQFGLLLVRVVSKCEAVEAWLETRLF